MDRSARLSFAPADRVRQGEAVYRVTHLVDLQSVLAEDVKTGEAKVLRIGEVTPVEASEADSEASTESVEALNPDAHTPEDWSIAEARLATLQKLEGASRAEVEAEAGRLGVHASTIYDWKGRYTRSPYLSTLIPWKRGRSAGSRMLDPKQEAIVQETIEHFYLRKKEKLRPSVVINEVERRCRRAGLAPPAGNTVRARINAMAPGLVLRRRGEADKAQNLYTHIQGSFPGATFPLAVVQIDHTLADIILVDDERRQELGRPWLTLAMDVYSRVVVGCHVSLDPPSANSVGLCLTKAILPKDDLLKALDVPTSWPAYGLMRQVHADNAREFRGEMLKRSCAEHGIDLRWRPVKKPKWGGHIERLMGTVAGETHTLPGTTFSNPTQRGSYDSQAEAAMTLKEYERHLVDFFTSAYHQRKHAGIGMPPIRKWERGILEGDGEVPPTGLPHLPADPARLRLDFMPFETRTVQPYGVLWDHITYWHEVLSPWINAVDPSQHGLKNPPKRKFIFRRDPTDISRIWFLDPGDGQTITSKYRAIPYARVGRPAITVWEARAAIRDLQQSGQPVTEDGIFSSTERRRERVDEAVAKTRRARRDRQRRAHLRTQPEPASAPSTRLVPTPRRDDFDPTLFEQPVRPFDVIE